MCLMHTDLPVPEGPRIIEILFSGSAMFRPRSTWLRPKDLCTSTNSIASGAPVCLIVPVWCSNSSLRASGSAISSSPDRGSRIGSPEHLRAEGADDVHQHQVEHHRLRGRASHAHPSHARVVDV